MSEENNFLKGQAEAVMTAAYLATEKPCTPVEDFAFWLRDLSNCASCRGNYVSLDHTGADVLAADADEAYLSKAKCRNAAEKRVDLAIQEAKHKLQRHMSISGSSSFFWEFWQHFDHRLDILREKLELLHTPENAVIVDEIANYLIASEIRRKAIKICGNISAMYSLQTASAYYNKISYECLLLGTL